MTTITLGGKEFTVRYPLNSIRALERETGKSVFQIVDLTSFSIDLMICVIWAVAGRRKRPAFAVC